MIIEWNDTVNKNILNTTSFSIPDTGLQKDKEEDFVGLIDIVTFRPLETYNVIMHFNWLEKDEDNKSEYDRFVEWYTSRHRKGVNPFKFPSIRKRDRNKNKIDCEYIISSVTQTSKHGFNMQVQMTWEEVYSGELFVPAYLQQSTFPVDVNKRILDSTSWSIGGKGVSNQEGENGSFKRTTSDSFSTPEIYSVTMDFDWDEYDLNGKTEFDRFIDWYCYGHRRGSKTFKFPSIRKFNNLESTCEETYRIINGIQAVLSGFCMRVTMTWETVEYFSSEINEPELNIERLIVKSNDGYNYDASIYFNRELTESEINNKIYEKILYAGTEKENLIPIGESSFFKTETNGSLFQKKGTEYKLCFDVLENNLYYFSIINSEYHAGLNTCTKVRLNTNKREASDIYVGTGVKDGETLPTVNFPSYIPAGTYTSENFFKLVSHFAPNGVVRDFVTPVDVVVNNQTFKASLIRIGRHSSFTVFDYVAFSKKNWGFEHIYKSFSDYGVYITRVPSSFSNTSVVYSNLPITIKNDINLI